MFKSFYFTLSAVAIIGLSSVAIAAENMPEIDGQQLEAEAEQILHTEEGAEEVTVRVEVAPTKKVTNRQIVNFDQFDLNNDGVLERDEIGETLFRMFDKDGNEVIDNIEMKTPNIIVFSDMAKTKTETVKYRDPSRPTKQTVSHEDFMQASKLARFDKDKDGLSPLDFLEKSFYQVNVKDDGVIDLYEWKRAYASYVRPAHLEQYNYNN